MIMDLDFQKEKDLKSSKTSQWNGLSQRSVFLRTVLMFAAPRTVIRSTSPMNFIWLSENIQAGTKYSLID